MATVYYVTCSRCAKRFYISAELHRHIQEGKREYVICPFCKERFSPRKD